MMENRPDSDQHQESAQRAERATTNQVLFGKVLREKRELLGYSIADVANQIKFAPRQIESLEADDFKSLPEAAFLRGFVRSYAKILQLDAEKLLASLPHDTAPATVLQVPESVGVPFPNAHSLFRPNVVLLAAAGLFAIIAVGFAIWNYVSPRTQMAKVNMETPVDLPADTAVIPPPAEVAANETPAEAADKTNEYPRPPQTATGSSEASAKEQEIAAPVAATVKPARKPEVKVENNLEAKPVPAPVTRLEPAAAEPSKPVVMLGLSPSIKQDARTDTQQNQTPVVEKSQVKAQVKAVPAAEMEFVKKLPADAEVKASAKQTVSASNQPAANKQVATGDVTKLRLEFDEESWTEIRDRDDNIISSQVNQPGSVLVVRGRAPFKMLIGHGLSVRLFHQDKQIDLTPHINKYSEVAHITVQ